MQDPHVTRERLVLLERLDRWLDRPMLVLSVAWVVLFVVQVTIGLDPVLQAFGLAVWAAFILDFILKIAVAPSKISFLRSHWINAIALVLPATAMLRLGPIVTALANPNVSQGVRVASVLARVNRGFAAVEAGFGRRGIPFVGGATLTVAVVGAAGMAAFEPALGHYGTALWWTAMMLTTMGSDYFPKTAGGRILCLLFAIYGFAIFGYITAAVASFLVGADRKEDEPPPAAPANDAVHAELVEVRRQLADLRSLFEEHFRRPA
jgi:voltage-gated potassium channel